MCCDDAINNSLHMSVLTPAISRGTFIHTKEQPMFDEDGNHGYIADWRSFHHRYMQRGLSVSGRPQPALHDLDLP